MTTYTFMIEGTVATPQWSHEMTFYGGDDEACRYAQRLVKEFVGVRWFMALHVFEERGNEEGRSVASYVLAPPEAQPRRS